MFVYHTFNIATPGDMRGNEKWKGSLWVSYLMKVKNLESPADYISIVFSSIVLAGATGDNEKWKSHISCSAQY